jgi:hypothetical protein
LFNQGTFAGPSGNGENAESGHPDGAYISQLIHTHVELGLEALCLFDRDHAFVPDVLHRLRKPCSTGSRTGLPRTGHRQMAPLVLRFEEDCQDRCSDA